MQYDHYIGVDWSQQNMTIARLTKSGEKIRTIDIKSSVEDLKIYLKHVKGSKCMTIEESNSSQWLYLELKDYVDQLIICDPYRNRLLSEGAKTDKIDAEKLVQLLRSGLLKPVFHSGEALLELRKIISGYEDLIKMGVRTQNQISAMLRCQGKSKKSSVLRGDAENFVLAQLRRLERLYEEEKKIYEKRFREICQKHKEIGNLLSLPGIGYIGAVKYAGIVVAGRRFKNKGHYLSYCGLIHLVKQSGGKNYGKRRPRYCRTLKSVFKTAAITALKSKDNFIKRHYEYLIREKGLGEREAKQAIARRLAILAWGVFKSKKKFKIQIA